MMKNKFKISIIALSVLINVKFVSAIDIIGIITYSTTVTCTTDIHIKANGRLIVTGTLKMATGKAIYVEKRGVLEVNGGTITHVDGTNLWRGIIADGTPNHLQPSSNVFVNSNFFLQHHGAIDGYNQSVVYLNEATISYALGALTLGDRGPWNNPWQIYSGHGGAILKAVNSDFINNFGWSVAFCGYKKINHSQIKNCTFTVTQNCPISRPWFWEYNYFIVLQDEEFVYNIASSNTFTKSNNSDPFSAFWIVLDSRIGLTPEYPNDCTISNMDIGMRFEQWFGRLSNSVVSFITLENNIEGIRVEGVDLVQLRYNTIKLKNDLNKITYGFYFDGCTGFQAYENEFLRNTGSINTGSSGIYVNKSGNIAGNEIRMNNFISIPKGVQAQQYNKGLQLICNDFNNLSQYDIAVTSGGIASPQGSISKPANNEFSHVGTFSTSDFHQNNGVSNVDYYHNTSPYQCSPVYRSNTVNPIPVNGNKNYSHCQKIMYLTAKKDRVVDINDEIDMLDPNVDAELKNYLKLSKDAIIADIVSDYFTGSATENDSNWIWEWSYPISELYEFLEGENCFSAKYYLVALQINDSDYESARTIINDLKTEYAEDKDVLSYCDYAKLMIIADSSDYNFNNLYEIEEDIEELAGNNTFISVKAQNLLEYIHKQESIDQGIEYEEEYPLIYEEIEEDTSESMIEGIGNKDNPLGSHFNIFVSNLSNDQIQISMREINFDQAQIYGMTGKLKISVNLVSENQIININTLPAGCYLLVIRNESAESIYVTKIIKQ